MNIHLTSLFGPPLDVDLSSSDLPVIIGRGDDADVLVDDRWVSRVHCLLSTVDGHVFVRDLESKHGTYVNESRIDGAELFPGDKLEIGLSTILFETQFSDSKVTQEVT